MGSNQQDGVINNEHVMLRQPAPDLTGEEIVITGISGIFPKSNNVEEFMNNLYNKIDMVTSNEEHGKFIHPEMPKHSGKAQGFDMFDAHFFRVPHGQAECMDPMIRKILEHAYGVLFDAGVSPVTLSGTRLGVFVGSSYTDVVSMAFYSVSKNRKYWLAGCLKSMQPNRITYWINGRAPSYGVDASCSSSMMALQNAFWAIKSGQCDSAIVGGCNHIMDPMLTLNLRRMGLLCLDGKTKCFDKNADGYVRSEAVSVIFLQRASEAKRIYAEIVHMKQKYMRPDNYFLPIRTTNDIEELLRQFYSEIVVSPDNVEYVEAYGAGIAKGDANELEAINKIFANGKSVKVGSVKSNMGNSEGAGDMCAITKVCLAYHKGQLPGNLHYNVPQYDIAGIRNGGIQVVTKNTFFKRGYTAINSMSYSGMTHHVLMKGHYKKKQLELYNTSISRLVLASGRIGENVSKIFKALKSQPIDAEQIALLHDFFANDISGHTSRGYTILGTNKTNNTLNLTASVDYYSGIKKPVWFMYSGMGSQWPGMAAELMKIPTFAASIERCRQILLPKNVDVVKIITDTDKTIFDNILYSFVGITAVQIGLTDLLRDMGIFPDYIIGHSLGEHGCAYADGSFTIEETILTSYYRGLVSIEIKYIDGLMAAVGLGHKELTVLCPPEIEVACHNSMESSTISGPTELVKKFVEDLKRRGIFAKVVNTGNIAYHSKHISEAGPALLPNLKQLLKSPKLRSSKWICTSEPPKKWSSEEVKYASAEYFTNNLLNKVYFHEAARCIPENATIIEISPHGLMQAILKRSHKTNTNIPLTNKNYSNPVNFLLEAIGKLYQVGLNPKISILYPKIQYPVSTETPMLSKLVGWAHDRNWPLLTYDKGMAKKLSSRNFAMVLDDDDWKYVQGHVRNGAVIFPEAALLVLVWETLAMYKGYSYRSMSVAFETVTFYKELYLKKDETLRFTISLQMGNGQFEIHQDCVQIVSGAVKHINKSENSFPDMNDTHNEEVILNMKDIYRLFETKDYSYKNDFQSILSTNTTFNKAIVKWTKEWVTFLDSLIQLFILSKNYDGVSIPKKIRKLTIDTRRHNRTNQILVGENVCMNAVYNEGLATVNCGGVYIEDITFQNSPISCSVTDIKTLSFMPHITTNVVDIYKALRINMQIVVENLANKHLKIMELVSNSTTKVLNNEIKNICDTDFNIDVKINCIKIKDNEVKKNMYRNIMDDDINLLIIINNVAEDDKKILQCFDFYKNKNNIFVLSVTNKNVYTNIHDTKLLKVVTCMKIETTRMMILRKHVPCSTNASYIVTEETGNCSWLPRLKNELQTERKIILVSEKYDRSLIGLIKSFQNEGYNNVGLMVVNDKQMKFNAQDPFYKEQIDKGLVFNIFKKGSWGGYYYLPAEEVNDKNPKIALICKSPSNTWAWAEVDQVDRPSNSNNLIQVSYAGPTLCDYHNIISKASDEKAYGMDFSGYNCRYERVMGLVSGGALSSMVEADPNLLWPVPQHWSLEDAATVPFHYAMAYYCLTMKASLHRNETILIIGGAGSLGQAIISICISLNCTVFATVSNEEKKRFLLKLFPQLKEEYIICTSGSKSLLAEISHYTKKSLCNHVISCATGELRQEAMNCVGNIGYFMDVNNHSEVGNVQFEMSYLKKERTFKTVKFSNVFLSENLNERKLIHRLVSDGIAQGIVKPLSRVVYSPSKISAAFRFLASNKRRGRVLIRMEDKQNLKFFPRVAFVAEASYLVVGCENYLGVELADWLIKQGARKLVLHQKSNFKNAYLQARKVSWVKYDIFTTTATDNLEKYEECDKLLNKCAELGPVQGIFIVQDVKNVDILSDSIVISNLDKSSRNTCHQLRKFVVISDSKFIGGKDNVTSHIENICETRNDDSLPGLMIYTNAFDETTTYADETLAAKLSKLFYVLENSIRYKYNNVISKDCKKRESSDFLGNIYMILASAYKNGILKENETCESLNINELHLSEIRKLINKTFKVDYTKEELQGFTFARFKNMCNDTKQNTSTIKGLRAFYNYIEPDEIQAAEPIVKMPSKISGCVNMTAGELDSKATHLIMIPGFEGHSRIFSSIGERLKIEAVTLQLSPDLEGNSIQEMAKALFKEIMKIFEIKTKFYLLGYSFGVNIALELAALLENEGYVGVVYCLDSSPDSVRIQLEAYLGKLNDMELQNLIIRDIYQLMTGESSEMLNEESEQYNDWTEKVEMALKKMRTLVTHSHEYKRAIFDSIYKRIKLSKEYKPNFRLESDLVLLKGIPHPRAKKLPDDYNLSQYSKNTVKVFHIDSDHVSAPYYCGVSNIVNKMLEPYLLEAYKRMNLCEAYIGGLKQTGTDGF